MWLQTSPPAFSFTCEVYSRLSREVSATLCDVKMFDLLNYSPWECGSENLQRVLVGERQKVHLPLSSAVSLRVAMARCHGPPSDTNSVSRKIMQTAEHRWPTLHPRGFQRHLVSPRPHFPPQIRFPVKLHTALEMSTHTSPATQVV